MTSYIYIVHYCIGLLAFLTIENLLGAIEFMGSFIEKIIEKKYYHIDKESFGECEICKIAQLTSLTKHSAKLL